jgi:CubicO group peptidase (beta-lactamase class C family)
MSRPTHDDWMLPPGNRWSFRHVRELIPTARVRHQVARVLPSAPRDQIPTIEFTTPLGETLTISALLDASFTDALVVLRDGAVAFEWYGDGVRDDDRHIVMSVTKSVTGLLAGALSDAGVLALDAAVTKYVPEASASAFGDATIRHLLDMTTATAYIEDYTPGEDTAAYRRSTGWYPADHSIGLHAYLCSIPPHGRHGERFHYISPNSDMLGWVLERASGLPYADALSRYLWGPIGAESEADVTVDRYGAARAAGGLCVIARDMARLGQLVVDGGGGGVSEAFVTDLETAGDTDAWAAGDYAAFLPGGAYRSCWYQPRVDAGVLLAIGIHGQLIYADRHRRVVVAKQSSWPVAGDEDADLVAIAAARAISHTITS